MKPSQARLARIAIAAQIMQRSSEAEASDDNAADFLKSADLEHVEHDVSDIGNESSPYLAPGVALSF